MSASRPCSGSKKCSRIHCNMGFTKTLAKASIIKGLVKDFFTEGISTPEGEWGSSRRLTALPLYQEGHSKQQYT